MEGIFPELVVAAALGLARRTGNRSGDLVEDGDDVDGEAAAFLRPAGLPFEEVEAVFAGDVDEDEVIRPSGIGGPAFPLPALLLLGAEHQSAEVTGEIAVSEVLGRSAGLAGTGGAEHADAGGRIGEPEGLPSTPIAQDGLRVELGKGGSHLGWLWWRHHPRRQAKMI